MEVYKIAGIVVATLIVSLILKGIGSELAMFPVILLSVGILALAITSFANLYSKLVALLTVDFARKGFSYLLKVTGICLVTDFVSDFSEDIGYTSLSNSVSLLGRICMMNCALPLIFEIVDL